MNTNRVIVVTLNYRRAYVSLGEQYDLRSGKGVRVIHTDDPDAGIKLRLGRVLHPDDTVIFVNGWSQGKYAVDIINELHMLERIAGFVIQRIYV